MSETKSFLQRELAEAAQRAAEIRKREIDAQWREERAPFLVKRGGEWAEPSYGQDRHWLECILAGHLLMACVVYAVFDLGPLPSALLPAVLSLPLGIRLFRRHARTTEFLRRKEAYLNRLNEHP